jgi:putative transposase
MARRPRFIVENQPHHIVQRGHNRAPVFFSERDYLYYIECLQTAAARYGCDVHAWCLMTNHIHLLVTPPTKQALSGMMQMIGRLYVRHINARKRRSGSLWEDRFKVSLVDADDYLLSCMRYIELNPVRARMMRTPGGYRWSSYGQNARGEGGLAKPHALYRSLGATQEERQEAYRDLFDRAVSQDDLNLIRQSIQGSWVLGNDNFRARMERKTKLSARPKARGGDRRSEKFLKGEEA